MPLNILSIQLGRFSFPLSRCWEEKIGMFKRIMRFATYYLYVTKCLPDTWYTLNPNQIVQNEVLRLPGTPCDTSVNTRHPTESMLCFAYTLRNDWGMYIPPRKLFSCVSNLPEILPVLANHISDVSQSLVRALKSHIWEIKYCFSIL